MLRFGAQADIWECAWRPNFPAEMDRRLGVAGLMMAVPNVAAGILSAITSAHSRWKPVSRALFASFHAPKRGDSGFPGGGSPDRCFAISPSGLRPPTMTEI